MSGEGGRRFRLAKSVNEEDEAIQNAIPPSTRYKTKWAVEVFREWQTARGQASNEGDGLQDISTPVEYFDAGSLAYWLGKFVQEVVNKDGQRYPGRTLYSLITGIKRFLAEKNVLLNPLDKLDDR